jgi:phosphoadenosine phosphosulfate reductase
MSNNSPIPSSFGCPCGKSPGECSKQSYPDSSTTESAPTGPASPQSNTPTPTTGGPSLPDSDAGPQQKSFGSLEAQLPETDPADEILENARAIDHDHAFALVSGGHDSLTAAHYTYMESAVDLNGYLHLDTGIGVPETKDFVKKRADDLGIPLYIAGERRHEDEYEQRIEKYGFPGANKTSHKYEWICNKDRPLQNFLQQFDGDVLLISGATREESDARWESVNANGIERKNGHYYAAPLASWTPSEVRAYRRDNGLPMNPVASILEHSGDCLCGAYADRRELGWLHAEYPHMFAYIQSLEARVIDAARNGELKDEKYERFVLWAHGDISDRELDQKHSNKQMTLCRACEDAEEANLSTGIDDPITLTEAALQLDHDELPDSPTLFRDAFDVTQAIPDDNDSPIETLRRGYEALDEVATRLGYDDHKEMIREKASNSEP